MRSMQQHTSPLRVQSSLCFVTHHAPIVGSGLALIQPTLRLNDMVLRAPGMLALHLALDRVESPLNVHVWDDSVPAWDMGALAAQWCSDFAGRPLRLVRFDPEHRRLSERRWTGAHESQVAFADGFALLVTSTASLAELNRRLQQQGADPVDMSRFRPNLVLDGLDAHDEDHVDQLEIDTPQGTVQLKLVKPCARCTIPGVDPQTGEQGFAVIDALAAYRSDPRVEGAAHLRHERDRRQRRRTSVGRGPVLPRPPGLCRLGQRDVVAFARHRVEALRAPIVLGLHNALLAAGDEVPGHETPAQRLAANQHHPRRNMRTQQRLLAGLQQKHLPGRLRLPAERERRIHRIQRPLLGQRQRQRRAGAERDVQVKRRRACRHGASDSRRRRR
jgi:uncharacterized protein YcbX